MGTKLPDTVAASDVGGDGHGVQHYMEEKYAWQHDREAQSNLTASVLRYTETGGNPAAHVQPSRSLVAGLADLPVYVEEFNDRLARDLGVERKEGDRLFVFYDVQILLTDHVQFDSVTYRVQDVWYRAESGRCEVRGSRI